MKLQALLQQTYRQLASGNGVGLCELAACLSITENDLLSFRARYKRHSIPKKNGRTRELLIPFDETKELQDRIYQRFLRALPLHSSCKGFRRGYSIVENALPHVSSSIVIGLDISDFFPSTSSDRVKELFLSLGWDPQTAKKLVKICTIRDGLPQGAPTSPSLSNLVNYRLDCRLNGLARRFEAVYTRYADDLTFSLKRADQRSVSAICRLVCKILADFGYQVQPEKTRILRSHRQQRVTGLVVNEKVQLPRERRRLLRSANHRAKNGMPVTLSEDQMRGWATLEKMIETRTSGANKRPPSQ